MKKKKEMISNSKTKPQIQNKLNSMEVKADKIMKKCEEEKERNESPDNSDNEEIQNINKIIKNSIPQTSLNNINTKLNIEQCNNFSIKLLKDRGCIFFSFQSQFFII